MMIAWNIALLVLAGWAMYLGHMAFAWVTLVFSAVIGMAAWGSIMGHHKRIEEAHLGNSRGPHMIPVVFGPQPRPVNEHEDDDGEFEMVN